MRRTFPALLLALVATALFATPATAFAQAEGDMMPHRDSVKQSAELTPAQRTQMELEAEVMYRCVLWGQAMQMASIRDAWSALEQSTELLGKSDDAVRALLFDQYKTELVAMLDITAPFVGEPLRGVLVDELNRLLQVPHDRVDWPRVQLAIAEGFYTSMKVAYTEAYIRYAENNFRLERDNPAVLRVRIPDDCPSAQ